MSEGALPVKPVAKKPMPKKVIQERMVYSQDSPDERRKLIRKLTEKIKLRNYSPQTTRSCTSFVKAYLESGVCKGFVVIPCQ